jgi:hypothetical protein
MVRVRGGEARPLAIRTIHKVGVCYRYECKTPEDQESASGVVSGALRMFQERWLLEDGKIAAPI